MKRLIANFVSTVLLAGAVASPAMAAPVIYGFDGVDLSSTIDFNGSFTFETSTDLITGASLQSKGNAPIEVWKWSNPPGSYYGPSFDAFDLVFRSPSAAFPVATFPASEGDIFAISFVGPLDGLIQDSFVATYETTLGFVVANGVSLPQIGNDIIEGCAAPGAASCAPSSVPEPPSLVLFLTSLAILIGGLSAAGRFPRGWRKMQAAEG